MILRITLLGYFLFSALIAAGQISIQATVDSTGMLIGDQQQLHLTIQHPNNATVKSFYSSALDTISNFEIISQTDWDTTGVNPITLQKDITFSIFDSGYYYIPRIPHAMILNGDTSLFFSNDIPISVSTIAQTDSTTLAPIRELKEEPLAFEDLLPYLLGLAGLGLIGGLIYWYSKRPKEAKTVYIEPEKIIPAHVIALAKLSKLRDKKLWQNGQQKEYHSELTYIVREYLENRYHISALESTTHEILNDLKGVEFDNRFKNNLTDMLSIADLVKFAKAESTEEINQRIIDQAEEFVQTTKLETEEV